MMNRAAVSATLFVALGLLASKAHADDETSTTTTTTANTLVVVTPNAPVVVNTSGQVMPSGPASVAAPLAPPGAAEMPPAPPAPPQNEDWNNVSHINGTPVPVGDRNTYLYSFKKNNIQTNPLGWMFGYYQVAGSHALSQNVAVSVEVSAWSLDNGNKTGYQIAATLPIYFRRTYSGPFLEGGLIMRNDTSSSYYGGCYDCAYDSSGSSSISNAWIGPEVMLGWSWIFDSGLNMSFALGAAKRLSSDNSNGYSSDSPDPAGYFRVGYAF